MVNASFHVCTWYNRRCARVWINAEPSKTGIPYKFFTSVYWPAVLLVNRWKCSQYLEILSCIFLVSKNNKQINKKKIKFTTVLGEQEGCITYWQEACLKANGWLLSQLEVCNWLQQSANSILSVSIYEMNCILGIQYTDIQI